MKFNMSTVARRQKWQHYPTPPTPRILQLPGRPRRRPPRAARPVAGESRSRDRTGKLEALFDQERKFLREGASVPIVLLEHRDERRDRVEDGGGSDCEEEDGDGGGGGAAAEEEKWRFQSEVLRAECNLLRMEKEIAVKKLNRTRINIERSLKCAIQTLIDGKNKVCGVESSRAVFDGEIEHLVEKLKELRKSLKVGDFQARNCGNFNEHVTVLQRRLKKLGGKPSSKDMPAVEIRKIAEASLSIDLDWGVDKNKVPDRDHDNDHKVDILTRKMEELSKDMLLERTEEECGSIVSAANRSVASSASTSKRIEWPSSAAALISQPNQEMVSRIDGACSGHCKSVVRRIMEQVRVETEQWSQMQEMLAQVRSEMEELQASRDFWEERALKADAHTQSLCSAVQEWRQRALSLEADANELRARASAPQEEIQRSREERFKARRLLPGEMEKRVLICRLKENRRDPHVECKQAEASGDRRRKVHASAGRLAAAAAPKGSPFQDIGNSWPMSSRQSSK